MKRLFVNLLSLAMFLIVCLFTFNANAQEVKENEKVIFYAETPPSFPGGEEALSKYLAENIIYPKEAKEKGIEGKVYVQFVINSEGLVRDVKVIRGAGDSSLDEEAIRAVKDMPKWIHKKHELEAVSVQYTLPIVFKMDGKNNKDNDSVYTNVEEPAHFPGGDKALGDFLVKNIKFPNTEAYVRGKVYISFIVEKDGSLTNIKLFRGLFHPIDEEAIRVVKLMPKWIPGKHNGEIVRQQYTLPIVFEFR